MIQKLWKYLSCNMHLTILMMLYNLLQTSSIGRPCLCVGDGSQGIVFNVGLYKLRIQNLSLFSLPKVENKVNTTGFYLNKMTVDSYNCVLSAFQAMDKFILINSHLVEVHCQFEVIEILMLLIQLRFISLLLKETNIF